MTRVPGYLGAIAANAPVSLIMPSTITTAPAGIAPDVPRRGSVIAYAPRMMMVSVIALHPCHSSRPRSRARTRPTYSAMADEEGIEPSFPLARSWSLAHAGVSQSVIAFQGTEGSTPSFSAYGAALGAADGGCSRKDRGLRKGGMAEE